MDCFLGTGTTGLAAKELNRNFIGIEIDKDAFQVSKNRINGGGGGFWIKRNRMGDLYADTILKDSFSKVKIKNLNQNIPIFIIFFFILCHRHNILRSESR